MRPWQNEKSGGNYCRWKQGVAIGRLQSIQGRGKNSLAEEKEPIAAREVYQYPLNLFASGTVWELPPLMAGK